MKRVKEIYEEYHLPYRLQIHQLKVAGIAALLIDNLKNPNEIDISIESIIPVLLFHDMGKIINEDFDMSAYGNKAINMQQRLREELSNNNQTATKIICKKIGLSDRQIRMIEGMEYEHAKEIAGSDNYERKLSIYADCRVSWYGIVSIMERQNEALKRYGDKYNTGNSDFQSLLKALSKIERQLLSSSYIKTPQDINDITVAPYIPLLYDMKIF